MVEQSTFNRLAVGSSPTAVTDRDMKRAGCQYDHAGNLPFTLLPILNVAPQRLDFLEKSLFNGGLVGYYLAC